MSDLSERFADLQNFIDLRQDQMYDVLRAIRDLKQLRSNDSSEVIRLISELNAQQIYRRYASRTNSMMNETNILRYQMSQVNFNHFKPVLGDDDYV